jgi:hypothetical protein
MFTYSVVFGRKNSINKEIGDIEDYVRESLIS